VIRLHHSVTPSLAASRLLHVCRLATAGVPTDHRTGSNSPCTCSRTPQHLFQRATAVVPTCHSSCSTHSRTCSGQPLHLFQLAPASVPGDHRSGSAHPSTCSGQRQQRFRHTTTTLPCVLFIEHASCSARCSRAFAKASCTPAHNILRSKVATCCLLCRHPL